MKAVYQCFLSFEDDEFPEFRGMPNLICETHEAPELLKREVQPLFPNRDVQSGTLSVITLLQHTDNDMSVWSNEMEEEREKMTENFFSAAKEIVARWAQMKQ